MGKNIGKLFFLFLASYVVLYVLSVFGSVTGFGGWNISLNLGRVDYFYALAPICGFFFMYFLVDWIEKYFETKFTRTLWFGVLVFLLAVSAYYVALFWFYCNLFTIQVEASVCSSAGATQTTVFLSRQTPVNNIIVNFLSDFPLDFVGKFFGSILRTQFTVFFLSNPYIMFVLGALFGWASKLLLERVSE